MKRVFFVAFLFPLPTSCRTHSEECCASRSRPYRCTRWATFRCWMRRMVRPSSSSSARSCTACMKARVSCVAPPLPCARRRASWHRTTRSCCSCHRTSRSHQPQRRSGRRWSHMVRSAMSRWCMTCEIWWHACENARRSRWSSLLCAVDLFLRGRAPNPDNYKGGKRSKDFWKQSETRAQLRERMKGKAVRLEIHDEESISMINAPGRKPTGAVFVFFEEPAAADEALRSIASAPDPGNVLKRRADRLAKAMRDGVANASSSHLTLQETPHELLAALGDGKRVCAKRAPEPSDVLWQNLAAGPRERRWRQLRRTSMIALARAHRHGDHCRHHLHQS